MILKKLTLSNFRQFKEKEIIHFSHDKDANITLILGNNTSGKTTILQSFLWCFYGISKFKSNEQLYNEVNANEMQNNEEREIAVTVELEHSGEEYIIERKQLCRKTGEKVKLVRSSEQRIFKKNELGERIEVRKVDVQDVMNDILPKDLSEYFFYDTERFGNITEKKDVTAAVKGLLGLTILENAIKHLGRRTQSDSVIGRFYQDLNLEGNKDVNKIKEEISNIDRKIELCKEQISQYKNELEKYQVRLKEKEEQLRAHSETMSIQKRIDELRNKYEKNKKEIEDLNGRFVKDFQNDSLYYLMKPLIIEVQSTLEGTKIQEDFIPGMDASSIENIIKRGYCICGTEIKKDSKEYKELLKALKVIPPQSIGGLVNQYQTLLENNNSRGSHFYSSLNSNFQMITKKKLENDEINHQITKLGEKIKGIENAKGLQNEVDQIRQRIHDLERKKIKLEEVELINLKKQLNEKENELTSNVKINEQNQEVLTLLKYAEKVAEQFQKDYDDRVRQIRTLLENRVNHYFKRIYHGNRQVKINDKYRVTLLTSDENNLVTDESAGLETVKNFSFIAGLVDLAKEKLEEGNKKSNEYSIQYGMEEDYPLVLDAPFSNVDEKHVVNISKVLPKVAGQLILIVMDKDWNYAAEKIQSKVGKTYRLEKKSELFTKIREENYV